LGLGPIASNSFQTTEHFLCFSAASRIRIGFDPSSIYQKNLPGSLSFSTVLYQKLI